MACGRNRVVLWSQRSEAPPRQARPPSLKFQQTASTHPGENTDNPGLFRITRGTVPHLQMTRKKTAATARCLARRGASSERRRLQESPSAARRRMRLAPPPVFQAYPAPKVFALPNHIASLLGAEVVVEGQPRRGAHDRHLGRRELALHNVARLQAAGRAQRGRL